MIAPKDVISPKDRWHLIEVLHIGDPQDPDHSWSMCIGTWKERNGRSRYRIGVRWNGRGKTKGNPMSTGHPTWFLLPQQLVEHVLQYPLIPADKRLLAETLLKSQREEGDEKAA